MASSACETYLTAVVRYATTADGADRAADRLAGTHRDAQAAVTAEQRAVLARVERLARDVDRRCGEVRARLAEAAIGTVPGSGDQASSGPAAELSLRRAGTDFKALDTALTDAFAQHRRAADEVLRCLRTAPGRSSRAEAPRSRMAVVAVVAVAVLVLVLTVMAGLAAAE